MLAVIDKVYSYKDRFVDQLKQFCNQPLLILVFVASIFINKVRKFWFRDQGKDQGPGSNAISIGETRAGEPILQMLPTVQSSYQNLMIFF